MDCRAAVAKASYRVRETRAANDHAAGTGLVVRVLAVASAVCHGPSEKAFAAVAARRGGVSKAVLRERSIDMAAGAAKKPSR